MSHRKSEEADVFVQQADQASKTPRSPSLALQAQIDSGSGLSHEEKAKALVTLGRATTMAEAREKLEKEQKATERRLACAKKKAADEQIRLSSMEHRSQRRFTRSMAQVSASQEQRKKAIASQLDTWKKSADRVDQKFSEQEAEFHRTKAELQYKEIAKEEHISAEADAAMEKHRERFDAVQKNLEYRQSLVAR